MSIAVQVNPARFRVYGKESNLKGFFDVDLGVTDAEGNFIGLASIPDWSLIAKRDGKGYFAKEPETPRIRDGQVVKGEDTYPVKDARFRKFFVEDKPTKESYKLWDLITEKAVEAYDSLTSGKRAQKVAVVGAKIQESEPGTPFDDVDDDDEFPF